MYFSDTLHKIMRVYHLRVLLYLWYMFNFSFTKQGEETFMNDRLIEGGMKGVMTNGINYREVRQYLTDTHLIR